MKPLATILIGLAALTGAAGALGAKPIFPFPVHRHTLDNGLKLFMVPFDSPGIIAYYTIVHAGSRNEVEPGHSGFAHFFEHMMFRGTERYSADAYTALFKRLGSDANAYTTDDHTCYHSVFGKGGLEAVVEAEADRFQNLRYSVSDFQQESRAVLGEYNKNYSNPLRKLYERLRETAFIAHTYKHTTMGFLSDIEDMPNQYDYSLTFFDRFYRPNNVAILVVGDIDVSSTAKLIEKYYGAWRPKNVLQEIPVEPPQSEARYVHIDWENETLPYVGIAFHVPAFNAVSRDYAALDVLSEMVFGENSPLYRKLVIEDQSVEYVSAFLQDRRDPGLFVIFCRIKEDRLVDGVKAEIYRAIDSVNRGRIDPKRLAAIKSRLKYSFAMGLDTAEAVADRLTHYISLTGDPQTANAIYERYDEVRSEDLRKVAALYLIEPNRTEVTLKGVKN